MNRRMLLSTRRQVLGGLAAVSALAPRRVRAAGAPLAVSSYSLPFAAMTVAGLPVRALVDTGSVRGIQLTPRLAQRAGIALVAEGGRNQRYTGGGKPILGGRAAAIVLGGWRGDEPVQVIPGDIEAIGEQVDTVFDAILGWRFLSRFDFRIDYAGRELVLEDDGAVPAAALRIPLDVGRPLPITAGTLAGRPTAFLVDTGAPLCNIDETVAATPAGQLERHPVVIGGRATALDFRVKDLAPLRRALGCEAVLGHNLLGAGRLCHRRADAALLLAG